MNISVVLGLGLGVFCLMLGVWFAGGSLLMFWDAPSVMITVGGGFCALMVAYPLSTLAQLPGLMKLTIFPPKFNLTEMIVTLVSFSEKTRREGLLSLDDDLSALEDPFLKKGLQLVVDGTDPELVRAIMEIEIDEMAARHDGNKKIFDDFAGLAPAFGMIGTLMGLVLMLVNLSDKSTVGPYLAVAIITTFYGAVIAYLIFTPMASNLDSLTGEEVLMKNMILMGILSIQAGENPRILKEKLCSYLPPAMRLEIADEEVATK